MASKKKPHKKDRGLSIKHYGNDAIEVFGARTHNLKNVDVILPRQEMSVVTGLSGSGKSTLAFDVIYAESNRRYMESLSTHARMVIGAMQKPDVDKITHLSPAIAIDQKSIGRSARSTVGTMTEIYDYVRILFATVGVPHCPETGRALNRKSAGDIVSDLAVSRDGTKITILAPILSGDSQGGDALRRIASEGYARVRFNKKIMSLTEAQLIVDDVVNVHIDVVIDHLTFDAREPDTERLTDSVETAMKIGDGSVTILVDTNEEHYTNNYFCKESGFRLPELTPRHFSFNSPDGACPECDGLGMKNEIDPELIIPNKNLAITEGAIHMWCKSGAAEGKSDHNMAQLNDLAKRYKFSLSVPVKKLSKIHLVVVLYGAPAEEKTGTKYPAFEGIIPLLERKYQSARSSHMRNELEKYMTRRICPSCQGKRLRAAYLAVTVADKTIDYFTTLPLDALTDVMHALRTAECFSEHQRGIVATLMNEIEGRLKALVDVGVGYLTLSRSSESLSGGEAQRIRLAVQIKSELTGVIYVLDEPTTGLHSRDTVQLVNTMQALMEAGNTLIIVEHDAEVMAAASWIVDMGPGAGEEGGEVVFSGTHKELLKSKTDTGLYLSGKKSVSNKKKYRKGSGKKITIVGATERNLKNVTVAFPLGTFIAVCGVSGSGKSSLVHGILATELARVFHRARTEPGAHKKIMGVSGVNKVVMINQAPIGRTPRSNAATYTGVFAHIRDVFAETQLAQEKGFSAAQFSFNMRGGRCEVCQGDGMTRVEMHLLPDVYVPCDACKGTRYNAKTLAVTYNGANIADVLDMSISYALTFFKNHKLIEQKLQTMVDVGLGYLHLGQSATNLSGGEAQRVKLATELARKQTGKTLYILDEPTAGLHFKDTERLLSVLDILVDKGNTVIVVEHNIDVIKHADYVIEMGPDGGDGGGELLFAGTPKNLAKIKRSPTSPFLR